MNTTRQKSLISRIRKIDQGLAISSADNLEQMSETELLIELFTSTAAKLANDSYSSAAILGA